MFVWPKKRRKKTTNSSVRLCVRVQPVRDKIKTAALNVK
jgi:hypothetical protein